MKTETLDLVRLLRGNANRLATFWERYNKQTSQSNCDKYEARFGGDGRFITFYVKTHFASLVGFYGSSSCSTFDHFDQEVIDQHFNKALNKHKELIFTTMADSMREEAKSLVDKAQDEIAKMQKMLDDALMGEKT